MNPAIDKAQYLIRRELWENRGGVIWTPVVIAIVVCVLMLIALAAGRGIVNQGIELEQFFEWTSGHGLNQDLDQPVKIIDFNAGALVVSADAEFSIGNLDEELTPSYGMAMMQHIVVACFSVVAFIVACIYLLGALFNDRKDRSILFWKSLPISETSNVLSKLIFAATVIPLTALIISIPVQVVGGNVIAWAYSQSPDFTYFGVFSELSLIQVLLIHMLLVVVLGIKTFPLFSWLLFASAVSRRAPALIAIVAPIFIIAVESLIFDTSYFSEFVAGLFFIDHFRTEWTDASDFFRGAVALMSFSWSQVLKIVVASGVLLSAAIWLRNNKFEL